MTTGRIIRISGPTVHTDCDGLQLYERVSVGNAGLTGEVVRLHTGGAVLQVYEDTRGLGAGEPVAGLGVPLAVALGPGMLGMMFDGLQRPLEAIQEATGAFIASGIKIEDFPPYRENPLVFTPTVKAGDVVRYGGTVGVVTEGEHEYTVFSYRKGEHVVADVKNGTVKHTDMLVRFQNGSGIGVLHTWPVRESRPYVKKIIPHAPVITGQRVIDMLFPLAKGGVAIIPGGFGTGKTVLEQSIAKFADVDIVLYVGCGERGNEMAELLDEFRELTDPRNGRPLMERTVLVVNTSNMPVAAREASIYTAITIGEYYRDMGKNVLFLADSISRWAEALREISTSLEEMPGEEGYPTYLSSRLSAFTERAGVVETLDGKTGTLSMILSVSPPGGDTTEPVTQALLRTTGVFLMLDTSLAHRRHFPAINWNHSYSLYDRTVEDYFRQNVCFEWGVLRGKCRELLRKEESLREVAEIVGVEGMQDSDRLVMKTAERIRMELLAQNAYSDEDAFSSPQKTVTIIQEIMEFYEHVQKQLAGGEQLDAAIKSFLSAE